MGDNKNLKLDIDDILNNNFLIADFMLIPELRERLENASLDDFTKLLDHFENEENVESFANTLKHHYQEYHSKKAPGRYDFKLPIDLIKEVTQVGKMEILFKALYNLLYNYEKQNGAVKQFIKELKEMRTTSFFELIVKYPKRYDERDLKMIEKGRNEVRRKAILKLSKQGHPDNMIAETLEITVEEVKKVLEV